MTTYKEEAADINFLKALAVMLPAYHRYYTHHVKPQLAIIRISLRLLETAETDDARMNNIARADKAVEELVAVLGRVDL